MRLFKNAELRLDRDDLMEILEKFLNDEMLRFSLPNQKVSNVTLHPTNKYVCVVTFGVGNE